jgi:hypothetical protein
MPTVDSRARGGRGYANEMPAPRYASLSGHTLMSVEADRRPLEHLVLSLLAHRAAGASMCPSEVARAAEPDAWRALMPAVRSAAAGLAASGVIEITQEGTVVPPHGLWRGPVRLRRGPGWEKAAGR